MEGNTTTLRLYLERLLQPLKGRHETIKVHGFLAAAVLWSRDRL